MLTCGLLATPTSVSAVSPGENGRIGGRIVDVEGAAVPNATVRVFDINDQTNAYGVAAVRTDSDGFYLVEGLDFAATYVLQFSGNGTGDLGSEYHENAPSYEAARKFILSQQRPAVRVDGELGPAPRVSGQVTDRGGAPLPGIEVTLCRSTVCGDGFGTRVTTDATGRYEVAAAGLGIYTVKAVDPTGAHATTYWRSGIVAGQATTIELGVDGASDIDVALPVSGSISGRIDAGDGSTVRHSAVTAVVLGDGGFSARVGSTQTDKQGNYTIEGCHQGSTA